jgi:nicotinate-nucleotide--dimethylbenzimidazole phosphoribosyltransferase
VDFPEIVSPPRRGTTHPCRPAPFGRLAELGGWLAARHGAGVSRQPTQARLVIFAGDHGIAARGVSTGQPGDTARQVADILAGAAAVSRLADAAAVGVRLVDIAVDADTPDAVCQYKVRRASGQIDLADALSAHEAQAAVSAGAAVADEAVDAGADLLIAGDLGVARGTPAAVLIAALTGAEPVAVVGTGTATGLDDGTWMRKTVAVRDALRRARPVAADPAGLLRTSGGADLAAMAGFLAQAAARRTPVLLDGLVVGAAALVAEQLAPGARDWWFAGHRSGEPAHDLVLSHLQLTPLLDLGIRAGCGTGALAALPLVRAAALVTEPPEA